MSKVENLKFLGQVAGEGTAVIAGIVANGNNYLADVVFIPKIVRFGEDAATAVKSFQADLAEVKTIDDAGRQELATSWQASLHLPVTAPVEDVLDTGITILTWVLESVGQYLAQKPAVA